MVKVEIAATELVNSKIEKLSLVTNGAIRQGFKILKTAEIPQDDTMREKIGKFFGTDEEKAKVAALFVRKTVASQWIPSIRSNGFRVEKEYAVLEGDILMLKQESYDPASDGSLIALTPDVAIQLDRVVKTFDPFPDSSSFDENVKAAVFFPGLHNALSTFADTVWNVLNEVDSPEEAATAVAKQVKAFGAHVNNLVGELPTAVFKMEQEGLQSKFAGSTVSNTDSAITITKSEEESMNTTLTEAAAGDLDGLLDEAPAADAAIAKTEAAAEEVAKGDEGAPKSGGSPGNPVVEGASDTGLVALAEGGLPYPGWHGIPDGFSPFIKTVKAFDDKGVQIEKEAVYAVHDETKEEIFMGWVEKSEDEVLAEASIATADADGVEYTPAELKLFDSMNILVKSVKDIKDSVEKQDERIEAISKTAEDAQETADNTVVMSVAADLDESLVTLAGSAAVRRAEVEKGDNDPFVGLLPMIEGNAA